MQMELAKTLRNYDRKNLSKDILTGLIIMLSRSRFPWLCPDCRASGGLWTVRLCIPDHIVWAVFHITSVHLRGGCSTSGVSRGGTGGNGNPEWFETGNGGCAGAHILWQSGCLYLHF